MSNKLYEIDTKIKINVEPSFSLEKHERHDSKLIHVSKCIINSVLAYFNDSVVDRIIINSFDIQKKYTEFNVSPIFADNITLIKKIYELTLTHNIGFDCVLTIDYRRYRSPYKLTFYRHNKRNLYDGFPQLYCCEYVCCDPPTLYDYRCCCCSCGTSGCKCCTIL